MLTSERLAEIRALTWDWKYENCSDHQSAVDDLLAERDQLAAEGRLLREAERERDDYYRQMMEKNSLAADLSQQLDAEVYKRQQAEHERDQLAAEVERVKRLEAVVEAFNAEWDSAPECTCHEAYKSRNRDDPDCLYHKSPLLWDALAAWREGEA